MANKLIKNIPVPQFICFDENGVCGIGGTLTDAYKDYKVCLSNGEDNFEDLTFHELGRKVKVEQRVVDTMEVAAV